MKLLGIVVILGVVMIGIAAAGDGSSFNFVRDYPGGAMLVGSEGQVAAAIKACEARDHCYRTITPRHEFRRACERQHIGPKKLARLLRAHEHGAAFITDGTTGGRLRWYCRPFNPEEVVF